MASIEVSEAFRPQSCPSCEYSLVGHPPAGVCPECGEAYDAGTIELAGVARGTHVTIANASPAEFRRRFLPWIIIVPISVVVWAWFAALRPGGDRSLLPLIVIFSLVWTDTVIRLIRRFTTGPAGARVRMNSAGIMQDDDVDEPPAAARWRTACTYLAPALVIGWLLLMPGPQRWSSLVMAIVVSVAIVSKVRRELGERRQLFAAPDGSKLTPSAKRWALKPRSWRDVHFIDVGVTSDDSGCRIVATSHSAAKQKNKGDVADIEVRCTREQAEALRGRLRAWWRESM